VEEAEEEEEDLEEIEAEELFPADDEDEEA